MKKVVLIVCLVAFATSSFAQGEFAGEKGISSAGVIGGYSIDMEKPIVGVDYRYNIADKIRVAPSVLYFGREKYNLTSNSSNLDWDIIKNVFCFNLDAHYLARITETITLYPIGGLGVSMWNYRHKVSTDLEDVSDFEKPKSETDIYVGLNLGFGGEMRVTKDIIVGAEFRYHLTKTEYRQAMAVARVAYYW